MRQLRLWGVAFSVAMVLGLGIGVGVAAESSTDYPPCTKKASPSDLDAAKAAHKAGAEWNDRGNYDKAITYWRDAYTLDCSAHGELINIANAYEKKGDRASALVALETYLGRTGGTNQTIAERANRLKESLANNPPPPPVSSATPSAAPSVSAAPTATSTAPPPPPERPAGAAPWVVVGVGGAALVAGVVLLPVGYSGISSAEAECPTHKGCTAETTSLGNTGRLEVGIGWVAASVGLVAVTGGLIWQLAGNKPRAQKPQEGKAFPSIAVLPLVGPREKGIGLSGSF